MIPQLWRRILGLITLVACIFSVTPVVVTVAESFTSSDYIVFPPPGLSIKWYVEFLKRPEFVNSVVISTTIAVAACVLATTLGTASAIALTRYDFVGRKAFQSFFMAPMSLPGIIFGLALLQSLTHYGIPRNIVTVTIAHVIITVPFAIRFVTVALVGIDPNVERAGQSLGASPIRTFWNVTFPLIRPGVVASLVFTFILSFDEVAATLFVSSPEATTLPVRIFAYIDQNYDPLVTSVSSLLVLVAICALALIERNIGVGRLFGLR